MKIKNVAVAGALAFAIFPDAKASLFDVDFSNNAMPDGWALSSSSPRTGYAAIEDGRFVVHNIDGRGTLSRSIDGSKYSKLTVQYDGSLSSVFWGDSNWGAVKSGSTDYYNISAMAAYNFGPRNLQSHTYSVTEGQVTYLNSNRASSVSDPGIFHFTQTFESGRIGLTVQDKQTGQIVQNLSSQVSGFNLQGVTELSLGIGINAEANHYAPVSSWIDNVKVDVVTRTAQRSPAAIEQMNYDKVVQDVVRPKGVLKVWNPLTKEFDEVRTTGLTANFDPTKDTKVLVHGWNGPGSLPITDYSLTEEHEWLASTAQSLADNATAAGKASNIVVFDWVNAASSFHIEKKFVGSPESEFVIATLASKAYASLHPEAASACLAAWRDCKGLGQQEWSALFDATSRLATEGDKGAPDEQIKPQGDVLAAKLAALYGASNESKIQMIGHSLGAGVVAYAADSIVSSGLLKQNLERLTLLDAPENSVAENLNGKVNLDTVLTKLSEESPNLAIESMIAQQSLLGNIFAYGKEYAIGVINFVADYATHFGTSIAEMFYKPTIDYNTNNATWQGGTAPENIGFDMSTEEALERLANDKKSITCTFGSFSLFTGPDPFGNPLCSDTPKTTGFQVQSAADAQYFVTSLGHGGLFDYTLNGGLPNLVSHSPTYAYADYFVPRNAYGLSIDFIPATWGEGDSFGIWINDYLLYMLDADYFNSAGNWTGVLDISQWAGSWVTLTFGLLAEQEGHTLSVQSIDYLLATDVPEPPAVLLVLMALFILAGMRSKEGRKGILLRNAHSDACRTSWPFIQR